MVFLGEIITTNDGRKRPINDGEILFTEDVISLSGFQTYFQGCLIMGCIFNNGDLRNLLGVKFCLIRTESLVLSMHISAGDVFVIMTGTSKNSSLFGALVSSLLYSFGLINVAFE